MRAVHVQNARFHMPSHIDLGVIMEPLVAMDLGKIIVFHCKPAQIPIL